MYQKLTLMQSGPLVARISVSPEPKGTTRRMTEAAARDEQDESLANEAFLPLISKGLANKQ